MASKHLEGLVRKGIGGFYTVETPEGFFTCTARGRFRKARISPYAGDRVRILGEEDGTGALEEILPRRNFLVRPPLANLDQLFIVSSLRDPYPEPLSLIKPSLWRSWREFSLRWCSPKRIWRMLLP